MKSWMMLAVIFACNVQLVHKSKSSQVNYHSMLPIFSSHNIQNAALQMAKYPLSTYCVLSPYSEITKRLLLDSSVRCQVENRVHKSTTSGGAWQNVKSISVSRYFRTLKWTPIPIGLGFALIAYQQFKHVKRRESSKILTTTDPSDLLANNLYVSMYTMLPLRAASRFWGWVHNIELPPPIRRPLLNFFISTYHCNLEEAVVDDVNCYTCLSDFFSRQLKKEFRPIHPGKCLVSPADGQILHFGKIENGLIEQVKGITYSLKSFLGGGNMSIKDAHVNDTDYEKSLLKNKESSLYHCVIYLAPGDYHKFHSPAEWFVHSRKHFHGELLSVRPGFVNWIAGLFNMNERVVYSGEWQHGFFSMTAVGATNVGSIRVFFDDNLHTNQKKCTKGTFEEKEFTPPVSISEKGQPFGEFNLGSTIVLIFEAPKDIQFNVACGQKVKYGELVTLCNQTE